MNDSNDLKEPAETHDNQEDPRFLPPRRVLYPSNKGRMTRYYYITLFVIFVGLLVSLIIWGMQHLQS